MNVLRTAGGMVAILALLALVGCGSHLASTATGQVTLDGQPLADGTITFVPTDGAAATASNQITDGRYQVAAPPGAKKVEIVATKVVGQRPAYEGDPNSPMIDKTEPIIPKEYNTATTLTADLKPGANAGLDFALKSKP